MISTEQVWVCACVCVFLSVCVWVTDWVNNTPAIKVNKLGWYYQTGGAVSNMLWHVTPRPVSVHVRMYRFASVSPLLLNVVFCSIKRRASDSEPRDLIIHNTKHTECHFLKNFFGIFCFQKKKQNKTYFVFISFDQRVQKNASMCSLKPAKTNITSQQLLHFPVCHLSRRNADALSFLRRPAMS